MDIFSFNVDEDNKAMWAPFPPSNSNVSIFDGFTDGDKKLKIKYLFISNVDGTRQEQGHYCEKGQTKYLNTKYV